MVKYRLFVRADNLFPQTQRPEEVAPQKIRSYCTTVVIPALVTRHGASAKSPAAGRRSLLPTSDLRLTASIRHFSLHRILYRLRYRQVQPVYGSHRQILSGLSSPPAMPIARNKKVNAATALHERFFMPASPHTGCGETRGVKTRGILALRRPS
jgi:hypothetical protein